MSQNWDAEISTQQWSRLAASEELKKIETEAIFKERLKKFDEIVLKIQKLEAIVEAQGSEIIQLQMLMDHQRNLIDSMQLEMIQLKEKSNCKDNVNQSQFPNINLLPQFANVPQFSEEEIRNKKNVFPCTQILNDK